MSRVVLVFSIVIVGEQIQQKIMSEMRKVFYSICANEACVVSNKEQLKLRGVAGSGRREVGTRTWWEVGGWPRKWVGLAGGGT